MRAKESQNRNLMRLLEQFFRISKCFQSSQQKRHNFSLELGGPKISKPFAHVQKELIKLYMLCGESSKDPAKNRGLLHLLFVLPISEYNHVTGSVGIPGTGGQGHLNQLQKFPR
jgi:hypothetical protein